MDTRQSIFWHQGLFLQPQHFQHMEMYQQFCREPIMRMTNPYPWGLGELQISEQALSNRVVDIRQFKLLLPDQTYLEFPGNAIHTPRSFDSVWTDVDEPLNVYVGIRRFSPAVPNVTVVDSQGEFESVQTRFASLSNPDESRDAYSNSANALIPTIIHVTKVFFENELAKLDDYDLFFVAKLERNGDQARVVVDQVPAVYALNASNYLKTVVRDIRDDMLGRVRQLEEYKSPINNNQDSPDANFLMMMQAVQVLNRQVPMLTHILEAENVHPWDVYGVLRVCVGEMSTFSQRLDLYGRRADQEDGLPSYDHRDLGHCFGKAKSVLSQMLSDVAVGPELRVVMVQNGDVFSGNIPKEFFATRNRFFLVLQSATIRDLDDAEFQATSRLAATTVLPQLIDHALPGLGLIALSGPPQGLPKRADAKYFRIEQISAQWEQVESEGGMAMYWTDAPDDLRALIVVTRG